MARSMAAPAPDSRCENTRAQPSNPAQNARRLPQHLGPSAALPRAAHEQRIGAVTAGAQLAGKACVPAQCGTAKPTTTPL